MATGLRGYINNFSTTLAESILSSDTTFDITDATGLDAILATSDYVALTIDDGTNIEIIHVTANATTTLTVERAMEGTTAVGFASGATIELRATAASFDAVVGAGGGLWEIIDTVTLTGSETEVNFEGLAAGIYEIDLMYVGVTNGGTPPMLLMRVGTGATPTYQTTTYRYAIMNALDNSGTVSGVIPGATNAITLWDAMYEDNAWFTTFGKIKTSDLGGAFYKMFSIELTQTKSGFGGLTQVRRGGAAWNDTTAVTAIKIYPDAGTFRAGGVITLLKASTGGGGGGGGEPSDGDKGDITVASSVWTIDNAAVTYPKIQNVSAASKLLGRGDSGAGSIEEITLGTNLSITGTTLNASGGGGGVTDHGALTGLADDDHTQYHNDARALTWLGTRSTTDIPEGTNEYYTDVKVDARIAAVGVSNHGALSGLSNDDHAQYHNDARALTWLGTRSTTDLLEGLSLYYTDERVDDRVNDLIIDGTFINWTYTDGSNTLEGDLSATGTPDNTTFLRGDNTWATPSGGSSAFPAIGGTSGRWQQTPGIFFAGQGTATSIQHATGEIRYIPFIITKSMTFTHIGINTAATAAGNTNMAIYASNSDNNKPTGSPISGTTSGSVANTTNAQISFTFSSPVTLSPGVHWLAFTNSGTTNYLSYATSNPKITGLGGHTNGTFIDTALLGWRENFTYSTTMPTVGGSLTAISNGGSGDVIMSLKVQ